MNVSVRKIKINTLPPKQNKFDREPFWKEILVQFKLKLRQLHHGDASKDPQEGALKVDYIY